MKWYHSNKTKKKKFKTTPSAGKVMITIFWDTDGVILVDVMARGETINSDAFIKTLQKLEQRYWQVQPNKSMNPGGNRQIWLECAPPSPLQFWSDPVRFSSFWPLKDALRGTKFEDDESMIHTVRTWLHEQEMSCYRGRHSCPCFALAEGHRCRWRLCRKITCKSNIQLYCVLISYILNK
jgi:hypothetical protein